MLSTLPARPASRSLSKLISLPSDLRLRLFSVTAAASSHDVYDVVCIGGGPAGLSLISSLQSNPSTQNLKIALVDGQELKTSKVPSDKDAFSNRCSSLAPSSVRFLRRIGAWQHLDLARTQPFHGMDVWDGVSGSRIQFDPADGRAGGILNSLAQLVPGSQVNARRETTEMDRDGVVATMCENANLTSGLLHHIQTEGHGLDIMEKTKVESIQLGPESKDDVQLNLSQWPIVNLSNNRSLAARLLIGADGANSPVRQFAGIPSHGWDYGQHGIVATLDLDHSFGPDDLRTAYQRFLPTGPIALLPLPGNKATLVWSISAHHATKLKQLPPAEFLTMINAAFRLLPLDLDYLLGNLSINLGEESVWREQNTSPKETGLPSNFPCITNVQEGTVASFPLRMRHASTYTGHRVVLIGDAAHTIHPLAGQGLNLGQADTESLAKRIAYGIDHGMDIGSSWCLDEYNAERWAANNAMIGVVDKLQKLYSASSGPVVWGRSLGLDLINKSGTVKGLLMGAAAGS